MSQVDVSQADVSELGIDRADTLVRDYDMLMELIRTGVRKLKPDPIPDDCVTKVLDRKPPWTSGLD